MMLRMVRLTNGAILEKIDNPCSTDLSAQAAQVVTAGLISAISGWARAAGRRPAIASPGASLDYAGLIERSALLAERLSTDGDGPVLVRGAFGLLQPIALLACLASARPLVLVDPRWSALRLRQILAQMESASVLDHPGGLLDVLVAGAQDSRFRSLPFDLQVREPSSPALCEAQQDRDAVLIFTSGSSGIPKGVVHRVAALHAAAAFELDEIDLRAGDVLALVSPPSTVAVPPVTLAVLAAGATLLVTEESRAVGGLVDLMARHRVTHLICYTGLARAICEHADAKAALATLRVIQLAGDSVTAEDCSILRRAMPSTTRLCLRYGASESIAMLGWFEESSVPSPSARRPMGRVLAGAELWLDRGAGPDGMENTGELYASGVRVARGYWRNEQASDASFPVDPNLEQRCFYKTGDLVRQRADGLFDYLGRLDNQVKLHGWRIEVEEIEAAARTLPQLQDAAVVARRNEAGLVQSLALYATPAPGSTIEAAALRVHLRETLPAYMVPASITVRGQLPATATGKIDRLRMQELDRQMLEAAGPPQAISPDAWPDPLSRRIAGIIAREIGVGSVDPRHVFGEIGGDSLQAVNIALRLENQFGVEIEPEILLGEETLGELVAVIANQSRIA